MSFDISHRDQYGFLKGRFDQGWFAYPIEVLSAIKPFLFPCQPCERIVFHVAAQQHAGLGIKVPFTGETLASTGKGYHALCNDCSTINSQLTEEMVLTLESGVLPAQICNLFMKVCKPDVQAPYSPAFITQWIDGIPVERADLRKYVGAILKSYALETDSTSLRQSFCWSCRERVAPKKTANGFLTRLLNPNCAFTFSCSRCGKAVRRPASI